jgi:predicted MFS family arabinose efflux permease
MPSLTLAQIPEAGLAFILTGVVLRLGIKGAMRTGLIAWCLALFILSLSKSLWPALLSLPLNGFVITLYLIVGSIWLNSRTPPDLRTSAQAIVVCVQGMGMCLGHLSMGVLRGTMELSSDSEELRWCFFVGAIINAILAGLFWWGFDPVRDPQSSRQIDQIPSSQPNPST